MGIGYCVFVWKIWNSHPQNVTAWKNSLDSIVILRLYALELYPYGVSPHPPKTREYRPSRTHYNNTPQQRGGGGRCTDDEIRAEELQQPVARPGSGPTPISWKAVGWQLSSSSVFKQHKLFWFSPPNRCAIQTDFPLFWAAACSLTSPSTLETRQNSVAGWLQTEMISFVALYLVPWFSRK